MRNFRNDNRSGGGRSSFRGGFGRENGRPTMHRATCDSCGKDCEVPFRPSGDKPVYCSDCFEKKGGNGRSGGFQRDRRDYGRREEGRSLMHRAVCDQCGKDCEVPFRPSPDKPVYCNDCFEKRGSGRSGGRPGPEDKDNRLSDIKGQLNILNSKLDKILAVLAPTPRKEAHKDEIKEEMKEKVQELMAPVETKEEKKVKKTAPKRKKAVKKQEKPEESPSDGSQNI